MRPGQILSLRLSLRMATGSGLGATPQAAAIIAIMGSLLIGSMITGCANPGPPSAPSLKLPRLVADLTAERVGDTVTLHWTMPRDTTDGLALKGPVEAAICRSEGAVGTCQPLRKLGAKPAAAVSDTDSLPLALASGAQRLLGYRVSLLNSKGRSAGMSNEAYVLAGATLVAPRDVSAVATKRGVLLRWTPLPAEPAATEVLAQRELVAPAASGPPAPPAALAAARPHSARGAAEPATLTLRIPLASATGSPTGSTAGSATTGSVPATDRALDATARFGSTYRYTLQAVAERTLDGHVARAASAVSSPFILKPLDVFPPKAPTGLEVALSPAAQPSQTPGVDLSWEPNTEPDLAGYIVYRRDAGAGGAASGKPRRINPGALTAAPTFQDDHAEAGARYLYSVSAVDQAGNESPRSAEQEQDIPAQ
ncbi:MAG: hypothetical protein ACYCSN_16250 [Acidobacteriaceae bacterium]